MNKRIEKEIQDHITADTCHNCCLSCKKYKTDKEQRALCEARKARGRIIDRQIYRAKKKRMEG